VEVQGAAAARPWLERAGATFTTVVDAENVLGELFGYKVIPNGIFLDERGVVRFRKFGGFSVHNAQDREAIGHLLRGTGTAAGPPGTADLPAGWERATALRRGLELLRRGDRAGAVAAWREALAADPENFVIRKQVWAVEHPERFSPTIDYAWQREQLARERAGAG